MQEPETHKSLLDRGVTREMLDERCYHADFKHKHMSLREKHMLYPEIDSESP